MTDNNVLGADEEEKKKGEDFSLSTDTSKIQYTPSSNNDNAFEINQYAVEKPVENPNVDSNGGGLEESGEVQQKKEEEKKEEGAEVKPEVESEEKGVVEVETEDNDDDTQVTEDGKEVEVEQGKEVTEYVPEGQAVAPVENNEVKGPVVQTDEKKIIDTPGWHDNAARYREKNRESIGRFNEKINDAMGVGLRAASIGAKGLDAGLRGMRSLMNGFMTGRPLSVASTLIAVGISDAAAFTGEAIKETGEMFGIKDGVKREDIAGTWRGAKYYSDLDEIDSAEKEYISILSESLPLGGDISDVNFDRDLALRMENMSDIEFYVFSNNLNTHLYPKTEAIVRKKLNGEELSRAEKHILEMSQKTLNITQKQSYRIAQNYRRKTLQAKRDEERLYDSLKSMRAEFDARLTAEEKAAREAWFSAPERRNAGVVAQLMGWAPEKFNENGTVKTARDLSSAIGRVQREISNTEDADRRSRLDEVLSFLMEDRNAQQAVAEIRELQSDRRYQNADDFTKALLESGYIGFRDVDNGSVKYKSVLKLMENSKTDDSLGFMLSTYFNSEDDLRQHFTERDMARMRSMYGLNYAEFFNVYPELERYASEMSRMGLDVAGYKTRMPDIISRVEVAGGPKSMFTKDIKREFVKNCENTGKGLNSEPYLKYRYELSTADWHVSRNPYSSSMKVLLDYADDGSGARWRFSPKGVPEKETYKAAALALSNPVIQSKRKSDKRLDAACKIVESTFPENIKIPGTKEATVPHAAADGSLLNVADTLADALKESVRKYFVSERKVRDAEFLNIVTEIARGNDAVLEKLSQPQAQPVINVTPPEVNVFPEYTVNPRIDIPLELQNLIRDIADIGLNKGSQGTGTTDSAELNDKIEKLAGIVQTLTETVTPLLQPYPDSARGAVADGLKEVLKDYVSIDDYNDEVSGLLTELQGVNNENNNLRGENVRLYSEMKEKESERKNLEKKLNSVIQNNLDIMDEVMRGDMNEENFIAEMKKLSPNIDVTVLPGLFERLTTAKDIVGDGLADVEGEVAKEFFPEYTDYMPAVRDALKNKYESASKLYDLLTNKAISTEEETNAINQLSAINKELEYFALLPDSEFQKNIMINLNLEKMPSLGYNTGHVKEDVLTNFKMYENIVTNGLQSYVETNNALKQNGPIKDALVKAWKGALSEDKSAAFDVIERIDYTKATQSEYKKYINALADKALAIKGVMDNIRFLKNETETKGDLLAEMLLSEISPQFGNMESDLIQLMSSPVVNDVVKNRNDDLFNMSGNKSFIGNAAEYLSRYGNVIDIYMQLQDIQGKKTIALKNDKDNFRTSFKDKDNTELKKFLDDLMNPMKPGGKNYFKVERKSGPTRVRDAKGSVNELTSKFRGTQ